MASLWSAVESKLWHPHRLSLHLRPHPHNRFPDPAQFRFPQPAIICSPSLQIAELTLRIAFMVATRRTSMWVIKLILKYFSPRRISGIPMARSSGIFKTWVGFFSSSQTYLNSLNRQQTTERGSTAGAFWLGNKSKSKMLLAIYFKCRIPF